MIEGVVVAEYFIQRKNEELSQNRRYIVKFIDKIKGLISDGSVQEASVDILEDSAEAILGDPVAVGKIMLALIASPFFLRDRLFWTKVEAFLNGVYLSEDDCADLRAKLTENGESRSNSLRLVECIDRAETQRKIHYLINATRCLLTDFIDRPTYFRICHSITHTLEEDLVFLGEHLYETDLPYNAYVQGLLTAGLMYQSVIDGNGEQKYSFTPLAEMVDQFAVSYNNIERYPNPIQRKLSFSAPQPKLPGILEWEEIPNEKIDEMFKK